MSRPALAALGLVALPAAALLWAVVVTAALAGGADALDSTLDGIDAAIDDEREVRRA